MTTMDPCYIIGSFVSTYVRISGRAVCYQSDTFKYKAYTELVSMRFYPVIPYVYWVELYA